MDAKELDKATEWLKTQNIWSSLSPIEKAIWPKLIANYAQQSTLPSCPFADKCAFLQQSMPKDGAEESQGAEEEQDEEDVIDHNKCVNCGEYGCVVITDDADTCSNCGYVYE